MHIQYFISICFLIKLTLAFPKTPPPSPQGRAFLPVITGMNPASVLVDGNLALLDEEKNLTQKIQNPTMNSEIWNFLTLKAQEILSLSKPVTSNPPTPTFRLLELTKKIMQKACPESYVNPGHFDMALGTFISLQTKIFKFKDEFTDHAAAERIEDSLMVCLSKIQRHPFLDLKTRVMFENGTCDEKPEMGTFEFDGKRLPFNLLETYAAQHSEPIVETVWKMFTHAHAACYKYFKDDLNDHHRFTTVVVSAFVNEINDVWKSVTDVTADTYSGLLGNTLNLMNGVAYCAEFPKLDTKYPWSLPVPTKDLTNTRP